LTELFPLVFAGKNNPEQTLSANAPHEPKIEANRQTERIAGAVTRNRRAGG